MVKVAFKLLINLGKWEQASYYPSDDETLISAIAKAKEGTKIHWIEVVTFLIGLACLFTFMVTFLYEHGRRVSIKELKQLREYQSKKTVEGFPARQVPMEKQDNEYSGSLSTGSIAKKLFLQSMAFLIGYLVFYMLLIILHV